MILMERMSTRITPKNIVTLNDRKYENVIFVLGLIELKTTTK
jgi:hypothetical protein